MPVKKHVIIKLIKIALLAAALWWVFKQINADEVDALMRQASPWMLLGAVLSYWLAQAISGLRMRYYFNHIAVVLSRKFSVAIYLVASFYNFLLPGGIGGDAYKVFVISRMKKMPLGEGARIAVSERASGLFALLVFALVIIGWQGVYHLLPFADIMFLSAIILLPIGYFLSVKYILKETFNTAIGAMFYSFLIQALNIICVVFLLDGLGVLTMGTEMVALYLLLFLVAAVASILPLTIGGVGLRELVFLYGAQWLGTDAEIGVALALMFFLVTIVVSMHGAVLQYKLSSYEKAAEEVNLPLPPHD